MVENEILMTSQTEHEYDASEIQVLEGDIPSPIDPPPGCRLAGRCHMACDKCRQEAPALREVEPGHFVACHLV